MTDQGTALLSLKGVTKRFGAVQALAGVDLEVHAGEVVALVGDNGAGKSTLVKTIAGIHSPDEGEFSIEGQKVTIHTPQDATDLGIATVYQDLALCDNLDVVANLFLGREEISSGLGRATYRLERGGHGAPLPRAAGEPGGDDPERPLGGGRHVGRPAPAGRRRALAAGRPQARHARRAHRRAGRAPDGAGAGADQAPARAQPRRDRDQPQPGRRVRGGRPHRGPAPGP